MYYEEMIIDGITYWRGTPDGEWLVKEIPTITIPIAEYEAMRLDTERYRWLKPHILGKEYRRIGIVYGDFMSGIDEAIDAAIKEGN